MKTNNLNGFLFIDKEKGFTSHDIINQLRRILLTKKIGHAGTLDPLATGLMIIGVGFGAKFLQHFEVYDKKYEVSAKLGQVSDSYDILGKIDESFVPKVDYKTVSLKQITETLDSFIGQKLQAPPIFSALKINGKKAYELARKGIKVELKKREIQIFDITDLSFKADIVKFTVHCSKGTYVRSLVHDFGEKLQTGALVSDLRRIKVGDIEIKDALLVNEIDAKRLIPVENILKFSRYDCSFDEYLFIKNGRELKVSENFATKDVFIFFDKQLIAYADFDSTEKLLLPRKVFNLESFA